MPPKANKPPPPQTAGRPKNARAAVIPVIPLPLVQKQQLQRQQKQQEQQRLKQQQVDLEKKQQEEEEEKERELKKLKEKENQPTPETTNALAEDTDSLNGDDNHKTVEPPAVVTTPADKPSQLASTATPQTVVDTSTSVSSPVAKTPQSSTNTTLADPTAAPFVPPTTTTDRHAPASGPVVSGASQPHIPAAPSSAGLPPNGHVVSDFVFPPHSRSGSAARHRGPPRHPINPQLPPHPQHPLHPQHHQHPGFHHPHPSASSITFGAFHDSNNVSPVPTGHGPLPPPPGLIGGPQFVPYNMPNMGPGEWQGPPGVPLVGDVNGFAPPSAGFNPSTPGSFHGSHSPDNVTDGPAFQHQGGAIPPPGGPNGHLPLRNNDSMSSMMSPPFFQPSGFPNPGPHERHGGRDDGLNRGFDFQFVHHLQQQLQHSFDNPQTSDCHLILHFPKANAGPNAAPESNGPEPQQVSTTVFAGHRSVLVQSQSIGHLLRSDVGTMHSGPFNQPILALHMKIEDPYISVDGAVQALRSLYGLPPADVQSLDKALANLTAGFIFMLDHVESVGAEQAGRLIGWDTVEKVLAYGLNGASFPNSADGNTHPNGPAYVHADLRYGRGAGLAIRRLLSHAVDFVVRNFPADFVLNVTAANSTAPLSTLLHFPLDTSKVADRAGSAPHGADGDMAKGASNGTAAHLRSTGSVSLPMRTPSDSINSKNGGPRSPKIVFGGFADESTKVAHGSINGVLNAAQDSQADVATVLSRILVNLPYEYLKYVLGHLQPTADRASITRAVVEERERRRLHALDAVHAGTILNNPEQRDAILGRLQRPTPPLHRDYPVAIDGWDVLGWKEFCHGETGEVVRVWAHANASR